MPYDAKNRERMGTEGLELRMPVVRELMKHGTAFTCAVSPAPVCAPARACLASGRRYRNCRVYQNNINYDPKLPSFYGMLRDSGYYVTGVGKFDLNKGELNWGDGYHDTLQRMGFSDALDSEGKMDTVWAAVMDHPGPYGRLLEKEGWLPEYIEDMTSRGHDDRPVKIPEEFYADNWIGRRTVETIRNLPEKQPWFLQVNFSGPHDPWDVTERMKESVRNRRYPDAADCPFPEKNQKVRQNYAAMIENIDRLMGECLAELDRRGMREHTLIVYSADHGEMMGDHGCYGKSRPEQGSIHIPMVIDASCLGGREGQCIASPVELQDLAATFLDYAGTKPASKLESVSLRPTVEGADDKIRDYAVSELITRLPDRPITGFAAITDGEWKLIMRAGEDDRLYRISEDPFELDECIARHPEAAQRLREAFGKKEGGQHPLLARYKASLRG